MALRHAAAAPSAAGQHRRMNRIARLIGVRAGRLRRAALLREHAGLVSPGAVFDQTDAIRSLERMARHAERILHYGEVAAMDAPPEQALWSEDGENARA
jgi:phosphate:Na+ symporter